MLGLGTNINKLSAAEAASIAARNAGSYLLDDYSGAAAAYSLRQLSSTYSGSSVKVRRASDNVEADIGFASGELDTTALASHCGASDGFVSVWYDQANSNNATQATAANQPKIYDGTTGVVRRGGKPSVYFVDSTDLLDITAFNNISYIYVGEPLGRSQAFGPNSTSIRTDNLNGYRNYSFEWAAQNLTALHNGTDISSTNTLIGISGGLSFDILLAKTSRTNPDDAVTVGRENAQYISELISWSTDESSNFTSMSTAVNNYYNVY